MAKPDYERLLESSSAADAGQVAVDAHGRVFELLDSVIADPATPGAAKKELEVVRDEIFAPRAEKRLDKVLS